MRRGSTGPTAEVRVAGLMCDSLCVRRVHGALESLPGVSDVRFVAADDTFVVSGSEDLPGENEMQAAVARQVVLPRMRRWLGWAGKRLNR